MLVDHGSNVMNVLEWMKNLVTALIIDMGNKTFNFVQKKKVHPTPEPIYRLRAPR